MVWKYRLESLAYGVVRGLNGKRGRANIEAG
jgi:hypothetical protein